MTQPTASTHQDAAHWAQPVERLRVGDLPSGAVNLNVDGRRIVGPLQGFGQLWQKTYWLRLTGVNVSPTEVIKTWREGFGKFWPPGNYFHAALTRIEPGEVAVLNLTGPGGMLLSTGVRVIYADDESFAFMDAEGHMFAAWITFSAFVDEGSTVAQVQALLRANDPVWEVVMRLFGFRKEDEFWHATLKSLAAHFGAHGPIQQKVVCLDPRWQWSEAKNVWYNAGIRTFFYGLASPLRWVGRWFSYPPESGDG